MLLRGCLLLLLLLAVGWTRTRADDLASRVIVLANRADPESLELAHHYAAGRGIPKRNIIALTMAETETIGWKDFVTSIWSPLVARLARDQWLDATPMQLSDGVGRRKYFVSGHRIAYLVVCRGVPLRISHDPALYQPFPPVTDRSIFRTNAGCVDGELSLLAQPNHEINGYIANPLFDDDHPSATKLSQVVKVTRLDGPTQAAALELCDHALEAERTGFAGRAYVDIGGIHPDGDRWLEQTAHELVDLGIETVVDRNRATFPEAADFEEPRFYFGWYAANVNGPFTRPGFRFPPGAVALHIHSFSAVTLRNAESGWCGPFIARGVTATVGNVFEPYLQLTHRPDLLLRAIGRGENFGDAACYAQPALSWQLVAIGDPLFRPYPRRE